MNTYCLKGKEMILDLKRAEWLPMYDEEGIRAILTELDELVKELSQQMAQGAASGPSLRARAIYLHQSLIRNQKYVNAYLTHRLSKIRNARWQLGAVLPEKASKEILSAKENEYFSKYSSILTEYNESVGLDVTSDMEPPKDLLIEVKVVEDCGKVWTDSGPISLTKGSILFLRRSQVEQFVREGKVEHILSDSSC